MVDRWTSQTLPGCLFFIISALLFCFYDMFIIYYNFCILGLSSLPDAVFSSEGFQVKSFLLEYSTFLTIGVLWVGTTERFTSVKFPLLHRARVTGTTLPVPNPVYFV